MLLLRFLHLLCLPYFRDDSSQGFLLKNHLWSSLFLPSPLCESFVLSDVFFYLPTAAQTPAFNNYHPKTARLWFLFSPLSSHHLPPVSYNQSLPLCARQTAGIPINQSRPQSKHCTLLYMFTLIWIHTRRQTYICAFKRLHSLMKS